MIRGIDCSGGGYGSPFERDPKKVLEDVICGFETLERAKKVYCVEIIKGLFPNEFSINYEKTTKLRK
jgi:N-methylhydantoinase B